MPLTSRRRFGFDEGVLTRAGDVDFLKKALKIADPECSATFGIGVLEAMAAWKG